MGAAAIAAEVAVLGSAAGPAVAVPSEAAGVPRGSARSQQHGAGMPSPAPPARRRRSPRLRPGEAAALLAASSAGLDGGAPLAAAHGRGEEEEEEEVVGDEDLQAVLFAAALGLVEAREVGRATWRGADPSRVALETCQCRLPQAECMCLGYSPLHCACQAGSVDAVQAMLLVGADPEPRSARILFGLGAADRQEAGQLLEADGLTPLHVAAASGQDDIVELLLRHGADPHIGGVEPRTTPPGFALAAGHRALAERLRRAALERTLARTRASRSSLQPSQAEACLASQQLVDLQVGTGQLLAGLQQHPRIEAIRKRLRDRQAIARCASPGAR